MIPIKTINSLDEYVACVEEDYTGLDEFSSSDLILFRGQRKDWPLLPKIARIDWSSLPKIGRINHKEELLSDEEQMLNEFKRKSIPYLNFNPDSDWDWLALAQHHWLPTRLLDWTENPLAALWFCVSQPPDGKSHGVVWTFTPFKVDFVGLDDKMPFNQKRTKVFQPKHITNRIIAQKGWFTVHKYLKKEKKFTPLEKNKAYEGNLRKLIIPAEQFSKMRVLLYHFGVNDYSLFPDLDGLCRLIKWQIAFWKGSGEGLERLPEGNE